jgi:hypothetical protein
MTLHDCQGLSEATALIGAKSFMLLIVLFAIRNSPKIFFRSHGWRHRLAGAAHLLWLFLGAWTVSTTSRSAIFFYDLILGILGTTATLTAAIDFPHKLVSNTSGQSGTLNQKAIVTQDEMIEHSFYQFLNLLQAMYLHASQHFVNGNSKNGRLTSLCLLWLVTMPWLFRHRLPVHSFSHNWNVYLKHNKTKNKSITDDPEVFLYRIKKWQYVFYKHVILHGVNISFAVSSQLDATIPYSASWRVFWILLNTSYVIEFFLQSMVKAKVLEQSTMLLLQRFLMLISSLSALVVFRHVKVAICLCSLLLNFGHRHHDVGYALSCVLPVMEWAVRDSRSPRYSFLEIQWR